MSDQHEAISPSRQPAHVRALTDRSVGLAPATAASAGVITLTVE